MEKLLLGIIIILAVVLVVLLIAITIFIFRYLKLKELEKKSSLISSHNLDKSSAVSKMPNEVKETIEKAKEASPEVGPSGFCVDHPDLASKGMCAISNKLFCDLCLTKEKDVKIARKFLNLFLDHEWPMQYMMKDSEVGADKLNEVMRVKKELWNSSQIPIITQKQFKINIENDKIEIFTVIMIREKDKAIAEQRFGFLADH